MGDGETLVSKLVDRGNDRGGGEKKFEEKFKKGKVHSESLAARKMKEGGQNELSRGSRIVGKGRREKIGL